MKLLILFLLFSCPAIRAQKLYSAAYGNPKNPAIIFIHGGPSGNSNLFEGTTANQLAEKGFFVIVYDRRGEGRLADSSATFTFRESFKDLTAIYKKFQLSKANILAHSFGGIISTFFTEKFPEKVRTLILADAIFDQQGIYDHILVEAKIYFKNDNDKLESILILENSDKNTALYRKKCFELASEMGFFEMSKPTATSQKLRADYGKIELFQTNFRNPNSAEKFYHNEKKNNIRTESILVNLKRRKIPIFAIYGKDDRIFPETQLNDLKKIVGATNFRLVENASHFIFVDQQECFLKFIDEKLRSQK